MQGGFIGFLHTDLANMRGTRIFRSNDRLQIFFTDPPHITDGMGGDFCLGVNPAKLSLDGDTGKLVLVDCE